MQLVAHLDGTPAVVTVTGDLARDDLPRLEAWFETCLDECLEVLAPTVVSCDLAGLATTDLVAVDAMARLRLSARRRGCTLLVRGVSPRLTELAAFLGLSEVLLLERLEDAR